jgi:Protein of unknown function (DUF3486)
MPPRSKVAMLPQEVRDELERRIAERAFSGYEELAGWLQEQGYQIAEDSVQRYGARLRQKIESLEQSAQQAKAIAGAAPESRATIVDATIDLLNERVFSALIEAEQIEQGDLVRLSRTVADLSRISIARQRWTQEVRSRLEQQKQAARDRRAQAERAQTFDSVRNALLAVRSLEPGGAARRTVDPGVSPAAEFPASDIGAAGPAKPDTGGQ